MLVALGPFFPTYMFRYFPPPAADLLTQVRELFTAHACISGTGAAGEAKPRR
jgi:hypothetical protein